MKFTDKDITVELELERKINLLAAVINFSA